MKSAFAEILSLLRRDKRLSQRCVATDLGISQALLSHYENGAREPKLDFVSKACDYYGVTADYILGRIGDQESLSHPAIPGCDGVSRITSAVFDAFDTIDELSDPELYAAAIDYLLVPIENVATLLHTPDMQYDPARDAELKMAEAALVAHARLRKS